MLFFSAAIFWQGLKKEPLHVQHHRFSLSQNGMLADNNVSVINNWNLSLGFQGDSGVTERRSADDPEDNAHRKVSEVKVR